MMGCTTSNMQEKAPPVATRELFTFDFIIGEGGFGQVHSGIFRKNQKHYAIKQINKYELLSHRTGFKMLYGELDALKTVSHPFIANMDFAFHDPENAYIVLGLKTGADLRYYLKKKLIFEECNVAFYLSCISSALHHCHSRGVLHRDVKPENIILDAQGFPHLTDFGVAYVQPQGHGNEFDQSQALCSTLASGTKQYLAPEVFTKGHVHGPESDFWSLGVVAYELLHGIRPFHKHVPNVMISYLQKSREKYSSRGLSRKKEMEKEMANKGINANSPPRLKQQDNNIGVSSISHNNGDSLASGVTTNSPGSSRHSSPFGSPSQTPLSTMPAEAAITGSEAGAAGLQGRKKPPMFPKIVDMAEEDGSWAKQSDKEGNGAGVLPRDESTTQEAECSSPSSEGRSADGDTIGDNVEDDKDIYGTFWVYPYSTSACDGLKVHIPISNAWLGPISKECQEVLQKLFEVRPTHRWGGRNIKKLREHSFFVSRNISDWRNLCLKDPNVTPHFIPGKVLRHEVRHDSERYTKISDERGISKEQEKQFSCFNYTHPDMIPLLRENSCANTASMSTTLSSSATTDGQDATSGATYQSLDINKKVDNMQQELKLLPGVTPSPAPIAEHVTSGNPDAKGGFYGGSKPNPAKLLADATASRPSTTLPKKDNSDSRTSNLLKDIFSKQGNNQPHAWISGARRTGLGPAKQTSRKQSNGRTVQNQQQQQIQQQKKKVLVDSNSLTRASLTFKK